MRFRAEEYRGDFNGRESFRIGDSVGRGYKNTGGVPMDAGLTVFERIVTFARAKIIYICMTDA